MRAAGTSTARPFARDGFRGEVDVAVGDDALARVLPDPAARVREGTVLRESLYRVTGRVACPGAGAVLLKAHGARRTSERWRSLLRPSRARAEWDAARLLVAAGLPVAAPLAFGERRAGPFLAASFYAAAFVEGTAPFLDVHARLPPGAGHRLLARSARLLRALHDRAFDHRDLHAENLLVSASGEALLLVDLHRARVGPFVSRRARLAALARWLHSLGGHVGGGGRWRTLLAYAPDADRATRGRWLGIVESRVARLEAVRRRSRAKRCFRESTVYTRDVGEGRGARRRDVAPSRIDEALRAHDEALAQGDERVVKRARKSVVTRHGDLVVKESLPYGWLGRLKDLLTPSRSQAGYRHAHLLAVLGIGTARPLAWVRRRGRAFALYEDLSDLPRLDHLARRLWTSAGRAAQVRLRRAAADWLASLHRRGVYHGDLKGVNVLVRDEEGGAIEFALIDTDRVRVFDRGVDVRRRVKNLAQLAASIPVCVTRTERLRFFRRYAAGGPLARRERAVARDVAAQLARKVVVVDEPIE